MSLLSGVTRGKVRLPHLVIAYGPDGTGKSTLASEAPRPIFLGTEKGTSNLDVARFPSPKSFKEVLQAIDELIREKHDFESLAVDSLDWLEPLVWEQVCLDHNASTIEEVLSGFGKGYVLANKYWLSMMGKLSKLREERKMNVILIAHSQVKLAKDPQNQTEYDRYQLKLNDKAAALWREYVDSVLFVNFETFTRTDKSGKTKAFGDGKRNIHTVRQPGFDAKSRFSIPAEIELPAGGSWSAYADAVEASAPSAEPLIQNIRELASQLDGDVKAKALAKLEEAGTNTLQLEQIQNRLRTVLGVAV